MRFADKLDGRPEGCPSDLTLDRLHAGELPPDRARALREHAEVCEGCRRRMARLSEGFAAFPEADPKRLLAGVLAGLEREPARPWWRLPWLRFAALGAAAAALLVLVATVWPLAEAPGLRAKGVLELSVFLKRGDQVLEARSGDTFRPGDRLRFSLALPRDGHVFLVSQDAQGRLSPCFPFGPGSASRPALAGHTGPLEGAVELDEAPGDEWIHLVHCPHPFGPEALAPGAGPGTLKVPEGGQVASFLLRKAR